MVSVSAWSPSLVISGAALSVDHRWYVILFCFLLVCVGGGRLTVVAKIVEHGNGVLCRGFCTNDAFFDVDSCVGIRVLCGLLCASCAHDASGIANLVTNNIADEGRRTVLYLQGALADRCVDWGCLVRLVYQLAEKSGWFSSTTASGGFLPLLDDSSLGTPGLLVIEAPDPLLSGDVFRPVHSSITWHVGLPNVLLMVPLKIFIVLRREGGRLHGRQLRPSVTRTTGRNLQRLCCNLFYFQSCLCKLWDVNYQKLI
ncbi:unnamed protein product [Urochloa humidicola]